MNWTYSIERKRSFPQNPDGSPVVTKDGNRLMLMRYEVHLLCECSKEHFTFSLVRRNGVTTYHEVGTKNSYSRSDFRGMLQRWIGFSRTDDLFIELQNLIDTKPDPKKKKKVVV